jgi:hypothetical protein
MKIAIWRAIRNETPAVVEARPPVWLTAEGVYSAADGEPRVARGDGVLLLPTHDAAPTSSALLVPQAFRQQASVNGVPLGPGVHLVEHADQLSIGNDVVYWIAQQLVPREQSYDPTIHGEDKFCARTKARINTADRIVICPGLPRRRCGLIYRVEAWAIGVACHGCKFDPSAPGWTPPPPALRSRINELLRIANIPF